MPDKAWKKRERDVAQYFNGKRTPLSGGNGKVTRADVIHDDLFIECKLRAKHTVVSLWDDTAKIAKTALKNNTSLKHEALKTKLIDEKDYNKIVDPKKMIYPA